MKVLIIAWIGSNNVGDELLFLSLLNKLHQLGDIEITAVSQNPEETTAKYNVHAIGMNDFLGLIRTMYASDCVVFGGGGIVQDGSSVWNIPYHFSRLWLARLFRLPILGIGLGIGPLSSNIGRYLSKWTLNSFWHIVVRDKESADLLEALGLSRVTTSADMVLSLPTPDLDPEELISVNLRPLPAGRALLPVSMRPHVVHDGERIESMARALDKLVDQSALPLRFISFEKARDDEMAHAVNSRLKSGRFEIINVDQSNAIEWMARGRLTVSTRFHAAVCSIVANRPVVLIGYAPKVISLARSVPDLTRLVENSAAGFAHIPSFGMELLGSERTSAEDIASLRKVEKKNDQAISEFCEMVRSGRV